jgi:beta-lactamase regulating signal transducer with metallopeptidase domain
MPQPETLLGFFWCAGASLLLGLMLWRRLRFERLLCQGSREEREEDARCREVLLRLSGRLRLGRAVRLIVTDRPIGPAVAGLLRPTVILPRAVIERRSTEELELMLAHELVHVRRGDLWFGLLRSVAKLIWWFHPLVWWASRQASREAERCCDEAVLAELQCGPGRYARCLLDVLEAKRRLRCVPACSGVGAIEITQGRLERIMRLDNRVHRRTPWWCWAFAILVAAVALPGAAIGISKDAPKKDAPAPIATKAPATPAPPAKCQQPPAAIATEEKPASAPALRRRPDPFTDPWRTRRNEPTLAPPLNDTMRATRYEPPPAPPQNRYSDEPNREYAGDRRASRSPSRPAVYRVSVMQQRQVYQDGVATYVVADILDTIGKENGLSPPKCVNCLKGILKLRVQQISLSQFVAGSGASVSAATTAGVPGPAPMNFNTPPIDIVWRGGDSFEIETTAAGHRRVAQALENIRSHGMGQIAIDVRFLTGPVEEIKKAKLNWVVLPTELPSIAATNDTIGPGPATAFDGLLDNQPRANRVQFVTEKTPPMVFNILAEDASAKLFEQCRANSQLNVLQAPKVTLLNGQSAFVHDGTQTPFVVAVKDGKPQIRVVHEGTMLQFRPLADADGKLKMDFEVEFSKIGTVETAELSTKHEGKPITIQVPEVSKTRVEGSVDLPWSQWLLLGGIEALGGGKKPIMVVMMRADKIEPFHLPPKQEPVEARAPSSPARAEPFDRSPSPRPTPIDAPAMPGAASY